MSGRGIDPFRFSESVRFIGKRDLDEKTGVATVEVKTGTINLTTWRPARDGEPAADGAMIQMSRAQARHLCRVLENAIAHLEYNYDLEDHE